VDLFFGCFICKGILRFKGVFGSRDGFSVTVKNAKLTFTFLSLFYAFLQNISLYLAFHYIRIECDVVYGLSFGTQNLIKIKRFDVSQLS